MFIIYFLNIDIPFNMNTQILIPLDDMTPENGATSLRPRSHIEIEYPTDVKEYRSIFLKKHFFYF